MTLQGSDTLIAGDVALADFRQSLTGDHALTNDSTFDLVVVLVPRWDILNELVERLPSDLARTILHPRPKKRCGDLNELWEEYEKVGCGLLAKEQLCRFCPHRVSCKWPEQ